MTLGERLKIARTRLRPKVTQAAVGALFDITDKAVSSWERGETEPERDKLPALRQKLRVTYAWLIDGEGPPPSPTDPMVLLEDELTAKYAASGERKRRRYITTARSA